MLDQSHPYFLYAMNRKSVKIKILCRTFHSESASIFTELITNIKGTFVLLDDMGTTKRPVVTLTFEQAVPAHSAITVDLFYL